MGGCEQRAKYAAFWKSTEVFLSFIGVATPLESRMTKKRLTLCVGEIC